MVCFGFGLEVMLNTTGLSSHKRDRKGFLIPSLPHHPACGSAPGGYQESRTVVGQVNQRLTMKVTDSIIAPTNFYVNRSVQTER